MPRLKGSHNKSTGTVRDMLDRLGCDPIEGMACIALNRLPCGVCRGTLKTKFKLENGKAGVRECQSCWGSGFEAVSPDLRGKMYQELAKYRYPQLRAIELSTQDGKPLENKMIIEFVRPEVK